jgi:hypothetical protein
VSEREGLIVRERIVERQRGNEWKGEKMKIEFA